MGWTSCHKPPSESAKDFLTRECIQWSDVSAAAHPRVVASATGPSGALALAVRFPALFFEERKHGASPDYQPALDGSITVAFVFLTRGGDGAYNFSYKDMDESVGPYEPVAASFLAHLSPLKDPNSWAGQWRERCRAYSAEQAKVRARKAVIVVGSRITLAAPIKFKGGFEESEFEAVRMIYRGKNRLLFRSIKTQSLCVLPADQIANASIAA